MEEKKVYWRNYMQNMIFYNKKIRVFWALVMILSIFISCSGKNKVQPDYISPAEKELQEIRTKYQKEK